MKSLAQYLTEGAWGYEPDQNDGTLDLRGNIFFAMCEMVYDMCKENASSETFGTDRAWEALGAIEYFFEEFTKMDDFGLGDKEFDKYYYWWRLVDKKKTKNIVDLYEKLLNRCKNDKEWIDEWKEPEKMKSSLNTREQVLRRWKKLINDREEHQKYIERTRHLATKEMTAVGQ